MGSIAVVPLDIHKRFSGGVSMGPGGEVLSDERISHSRSGAGEFSAASRSAARAVAAEEEARGARRPGETHREHRVGDQAGPESRRARACS